MSTFTVVLLCAQACLLQTMFGQCLGAGAGYGARFAAPAAAIAPVLSCGGAALNYGRAALSYGGAAAPGALAGEYGYSGALGYRASASLSAYGGSGEGNVAVAGDLPVSGAVSFGGNVPACGAVSIQGQCSCGCGY